MKIYNLIILLALMISCSMSKASSSDDDHATPVDLFTCKIPSASSDFDMEVEVTAIQRGSSYEIVEGANLSQPNIIKIEKPVFERHGKRCLFLFKTRGTVIFVDKQNSNGEMFTRVKTLSKNCTFSKEVKGCDAEPEKAESKSQQTKPPKKSAQ